jgi:hypothetical protein
MWACSRIWRRRDIERQLVNHGQAPVSCGCFLSLKLLTREKKGYASCPLRLGQVFTVLWLPCPDGLERDVELAADQGSVTLDSGAFHPSVELGMTGEKTPGESGGLLAERTEGLAAARRPPAARSPTAR